jgi:hypothetical protein
MATEPDELNQTIEETLKVSEPLVKLREENTLAQMERKQRIK